MRPRLWVLAGSLVLLGAVAISAFLPAPGVPSLGPADLAGDEFRRRPEAPREELRGRLLGSDGAPRAGYLILGENAGRLVHARSAADGSFRLEALAPGELDLSLVGPELPLCSRRVQVPSPGEVQLVLDPPLPPLETTPAIERSALVGRLTLAFSDPAEGYELWLAPLPELESGGFALSGLSGAIERRIRVAAGGDFRVEDLVHGRYALAVLPPWAAGGDWPLLLELAIDHRGESEPLELTTLSGQVLARLLDQRGRPLQGARLELAAAGQAARLFPPAFSGPDGRLRAIDLPPGSYRATLTVGNARRETLLRINALRSTELDPTPLDLERAPPDK
jgi:hypothetical protein